MGDFFKEYMEFLKKNKKWILIPLVALIIVVILLIIFSRGGSQAPFTYNLF
ncbi:MAG: DUF5989 family protein [Candidatus Eremiobacteraeota bacterium]|nr:DUF5989 family protein [Candidatus Eremiobacteraeota bacterium]